eukprot:gene24515-27725_t
MEPVDQSTNTPVILLDVDASDSSEPFTVESYTVDTEPVKQRTNKPIVLLDVDGVINMFGHTSCLESWADTKTTFVNDFRIKYSPAVIEKINRWNTVAEVRWLTTWDSRAQTMLAPELKLDKFDLARDPELGLSKTQAAQKTAEEVGPDRLIIWIDDELSVWARPNGSGKSILSWRSNTVLVSPGDGLRPEHIDFIDKILENPELRRPLTKFFEEVCFV